MPDEPKNKEPLKSPSLPIESHKFQEDPQKILVLTAYNELLTPKNGVQ